MLDFHLGHGAVATLGVREHRVQIPYGVIETVDDFLVGMREKPVQTCFINAGIYVLDPSMLNHVERGEPLDMPTLLGRAVKRRQPVAAFPVTEYWMDIGRIEDLERATKDFSDIFEGQAERVL
jgi:NDP-sugar pyrophosphorylase family protein